MANGLTAVPKEYVARMWPEVVDHLQMAVDESHGKAIAVDILERLLSGDYGLWVWLSDNNVVASFVTQIIKYPQRKSLGIPFIGGDPHRMTEWFTPSLAVFEDYAKKEGCDMIEGYGRRAWLKYVEPAGFGVGYIAFEKYLKE